MIPAHLLAKSSSRREKNNIDSCLYMGQTKFCFEFVVRELEKLRAECIDQGKKK